MSDSIKDATVLVVEDNVSNFVLIARMLGYMGIHCEWKTSGYEVVEYADTLPRLDLVLMDIRLPYEDGYGALKKIRNSPNLQNTKVVAVTAARRDRLRGHSTGRADQPVVAVPVADGTLMHRIVVHVVAAARPPGQIQLARYRCVLAHEQRRSRGAVGDPTRAERLNTC